MLDGCWNVLVGCPCYAWIIFFHIALESASWMLECVNWMPMPCMASISTDSYVVITGAFSILLGCPCVGHAILNFIK